MLEFGFRLLSFFDCATLHLAPLRLRPISRSGGRRGGSARKGASRHARGNRHAGRMEMCGDTRCVRADPIVLAGDWYGTYSPH
jgi:uncharacterized membrane protein